MEIEKKLFVYKFQPIYFCDYEIDDEIVQTLKTLIKMNAINILLIKPYLKTYK